MGSASDSRNTITRTRNFCIIAHVDHGKSTLSDRIIERCTGSTIPERMLDRLELERTRGITIKAQAVGLDYTDESGALWHLNLIDTPGHVDFSYEVSRSLAACEGAVLLVDATQGVQAQTVANCYAALDQNLEVLVVLNKIDVAHADPENTKQQIEDIIGLDTSDALEVSAKDGTGVEALLQAVVARVPHPSGDAQAPTRGLILDSWFDAYKGVVSLVRVVDGAIVGGQKLCMLSTGQEHRVEECAIYSPEFKAIKSLGTGGVGTITAGIKDLAHAPVGDTLGGIMDLAPLPGFKEIKPRVFAGLFPVQGDDFESFRTALQKLRLNDAAITAEPESSEVLGFGFRCGFLGTLHMEVVEQRLQQEFNLDLITTSPQVAYEVLTTKQKTLKVSNPSGLPPRQHIAEIREPMAEVRIMVNQEHLGKVIQLCIDRRGQQTDLNFSGSQAILHARLPLSELIVDFFDRLKSISRGYASYDYRILGYEKSALERLDVLINGQRVDSLSVIVHKSDLVPRAKDITGRLRELIPRQMFEVPIQAAVGGRILARENIRAMRKNVTAKCYGGDITRKRKLLERQKAGKKKMRLLGKVEVPNSIFKDILTTE